MKTKFFHFVLNTALSLAVAQTINQQPFSYKPDNNAANNITTIVESFRKDPIAFKKTNMDPLINMLSNKEIDVLIDQLYEGLSGIQENSDADKGVMGRLNIRYNKRHTKIFNKKIRKGDRNNYKMVVIEGDSWFNFPTPLKSDLTKLLRKKPDLLVYSSAFGGDWISRMIKDQSYARQIERLRPDAFILSGGGNDIVGERLSTFVDLPYKNELVATRFKIKEHLSKSAISGGVEDLTSLFSYGKNPDEEVMEGTKYLNLNFFKMLVELELQYKIIHRQITNLNLMENNPGNQIKIITQGYDYPIPRHNKAPFWCNPWRALLNRALGSGKWLYMPLKTKGINDPENQRKVMKAMMYYFNEMLVNIASKKEDGRYNYPFAYHVDNRGLIARLSGVEPARYWFDELHPKKKPYKVIAKALHAIITDTTSNPASKIIYSTNYINLSDEEINKKANRINHCGCFKTK